MERREEKQDASYPSVEDVETLIRDAGEEADQVVLANKQNEKRYLRDCEPGSPYSKRLQVLRAGYIVIDKLQGQDE